MERERFEQPTKSEIPKGEKIMDLEEAMGMINHFLKDYSYDLPGPFLSREDRKKLEGSENPKDKERLERYEKSMYRINHINAALQGILFLAELYLPEETEYFNRKFYEIKDMITESKANQGEPMPFQVVLKVRGLLNTLKRKINEKIYG